MKRQLRLSAIVTSLVFPLLSLQLVSASQIKIEEQYKNSQLVTINIPNFKPEARWDKRGTIDLIIHQAMLAAPIDQILRANEGRMKDTKFQKFDVSNMRFSLVEERLDQCGNRPNCIPRIIQFQVALESTVTGNFNSEKSLHVQ
ncbi:hypothetical protein [Nostoc sp.]|uniref:hypothetical protein n=1 Tax=Nostoc sp. TaxID=1180 RepID=UPI002FF67089